ncbi:HAMP domain-containing histidine kinase [Lentibacillus lipolyticus]|nr:HAMP domain-containing histidine kinase [Lentibacillus lipolyticus]
MQVIKRLLSLLPNGLLWRLSALNIIIIAAAITLSGLAIYQTACFLVDSMGSLEGLQQRRFNTTLFQYLLIFAIIIFLSGSLLHYYLTKKLVKPIKNLIDATKQLKQGNYPSPAEETAQGEVGDLVTHFNGLVRQLRASDESRRKMIADLSHELRTPLTNLNGYLKALRDGDIEGNKTLYDALHKEARHLTKMTEQIELLKEWGDMSSRVYTEYKEVDMAEVIEQCAAMFQWKLEQEQLNIRVEVDSCIMPIHRDGIRQVISNLIENAIYYYQGEGNITLTGKRINDAYHVSVSGSSNPIPEEEQDRVFERFYRSDDARNRQHGSSGLGLAIAKEIIEKHNGQIGLTTGDDYNIFWFTIYGR